jgi:hypothetical protein
VGWRTEAGPDASPPLRLASERRDPNGKLLDRKIVTSSTWTRRPLQTDGPTIVRRLLRDSPDAEGRDRARDDAHRVAIDSRGSANSRPHTNLLSSRRLIPRLARFDHTRAARAALPPNADSPNTMGRCCGEETCCTPYVLKSRKVVLRTCKVLRTGGERCRAAPLRDASTISGTTPNGRTS